MISVQPWLNCGHGLSRAMFSNPRFEDLSDNGFSLRGIWFSERRELIIKLGSASIRDQDQ